MKQFLIFSAAVCTLFVSCKEEYPCDSAKSGIGFVSFPANETDTVIVRKFLKTANFTISLDTFSLNRLNSFYQSANDTLQIINFSGIDGGILGNHDYEIILPETGRKFQITEISEEVRSQGSGGVFSMDKAGCTNLIKSYKLNGQTVTGDYHYSFFYITR